jgi:hypothetical protein
VKKKKKKKKKTIKTTKKPIKKPVKPTVWTSFMDMHSGGGCKEEPFEHIFIQAPIEEAKIVFFNRFGHSPVRVSCTCCGSDYYIDEHTSLEQATADERGCGWDAKKECYVEKGGDRQFSLNKYCTLAEYRKHKDVLIIPESDIKPHERKGTLPQQGFVWVD